VDLQTKTMKAKIIIRKRTLPAADAAAAMRAGSIYREGGRVVVSYIRIFPGFRSRRGRVGG